MLANNSLHACLIAAAVAVTCAPAGETRAATISTTDLWQLATVTANSGVVPQSNINDMFGATSSAVEAGNTVFKDGFPTGTIHSVEWMTSGAVTLRSFMLFAAHDGSPRDAQYRGFSTFNLYAFNTGTNVFDLIFTYSPANPYANSVAPAFGVFETNGYNVLVIGSNLVPVTTSKFRAEFVQYGLVDPSASGPRIAEIDGFDTFIQSAPVPSAVPLPAPFLLLAAVLGALGLGGWWRKRHAVAA